MPSDHQQHEERSLRMHRMVAERFYETPDHVVRFGLGNLERWRQRGVECDDFKVWEEILQSRPQTFPAILCDPGEDAVRLRQSSPFAGLISEDIRRRIMALAE